MAQLQLGQKCYANDIPQGRPRRKSLYIGDLSSISAGPERTLGTTFPFQGKDLSQIEPPGVDCLVPGVDPGFAFVPRTVTTRLVSKSVTTIADDGTLMITIENQPAEGEQYAPSITTLRGRRVSAAGIGVPAPRAAARNQGAGAEGDPAAK